MPLKIILKKDEKIIVNGAVIQNIGGSIRALVLNEAAILREKDIVTEDMAATPASRAYFALQNLYLFPEKHATYLPLVHSFFTDYGKAAPSAGQIVAEVLKDVTDGHLYRALRRARDLVAHEGGIFRHAQEELSAELPDRPGGRQSEADGGLGADRGGEET